MMVSSQSYDCAIFRDCVANDESVHYRWHVTEYD